MNCIIIEDEIPAQRILQNYISKLPEINILGIYQSALDANNSISTLSIDCIFLDINLPDISGLQYIKTIPNSPAIIMTTAYPEHAVESFELENICDYLVKPFSFERFLKAINKCKKRINKVENTTKLNLSNSEEIFLNIDKTLHKLVLSDILFIQSDKNYITIVTKDKKLTYLDSLKNWVVKLPETSFIQVHKSFIINYNFVDKIIGSQLSINNQIIPIGRNFKKEFITILKIK